MNTHSDRTSSYTQHNHTRQWRNGADDTPVTDPEVILIEEQLKIDAEAEDAEAAAGPTAHALHQRCRGARVDFILAMTFDLNLWHWKTWEVVQFVIKPATEGERRCRFADLPFVRPYFGAATVFMVSWTSVVGGTGPPEFVDYFGVHLPHR